MEKLCYYVVLNIELPTRLWGTTNMLKIAVAIASLLVINGPVQMWAQNQPNNPSQNPPHIHGNDDVPDWYDPSCCNNRDCKRVPFNTIEFVPEASIYLEHDDVMASGPAIKYLPTGNIFPKVQWRNSRDGFFHVCINTHSGSSLCLYRPIDASLPSASAIDPAL